MSRPVEAGTDAEDTSQVNVLDGKELLVWHLSKAGGLELKQTRPDVTNKNPHRTGQCGRTDKSS
eukprot:11580522-Karenia_brevis.AAC.1